MKRVMKFVKKNIVGFILGIMITGIGVVTASTIIPATGVTYSNDSSNVSNVNEALDELFTKVGEGKEIQSLATTTFVAPNKKTASYTYTVPENVNYIFISIAAGFMVNWDTDSNTSGGGFSITKNGTSVSILGKSQLSVGCKGLEGENNQMGGGYYFGAVQAGDKFVMTATANSGGNGDTVTAILSVQIAGV